LSFFAKTSFLFCANVQVSGKTRPLFKRTRSSAPERMNLPYTSPTDQRFTPEPTMARNGVLAGGKLDRRSAEDHRHPKPSQKVVGADLGLYSITFTSAEEAVKVYHDRLKKCGIKPLRDLAADLQLTKTMMRYR
jgi:hypothetical protein